jgi:putative addiction module killer protein
MDDSKIELLEYLTEDGENPFHNWLISLKDRSARARIRVRLNHVRLGNLGDCKAVGKGVNELRVDCGPGYRVYYGKSGTTVVILLCGGSKKSQSKDIRLAQAYWADFQRRGK